MKRVDINPNGEDKLDYTWLFSEWVVDDPVVSAIVTVPEGLVLTDPAEVLPNSDVVTWFEVVGTAKKAYVVACQVTTQAGRKKTRRAMFVVKEH